MKKKKALLALIVVAIVASIGALGYLALSYFGSSARSSNAGGELSIDYLVSEKDVVEEDTQSDSSKNIFQWLKERLSADKAQEEVTLQTETSGPSNTQSGMSQSIRQSEDEEETDLNPVQQAVKDAQQTNTGKKKDDQTDDTPEEDQNTQPEQPAQEGAKSKGQPRQKSQPNRKSGARKPGDKPAGENAERSRNKAPAPKPAEGTTPNGEKRADGHRRRHRGGRGRNKSTTPGNAAPSTPAAE